MKDSVVLFLFMGIFLIVLLYELQFSIKSILFKNKDEIVICNRDEILDKWIRNIPARSTCPEYTNELVVKSDYNLYKKGVSTLNDCCFFSDESVEKIDRPGVCNGILLFNRSNLDEPQFSIQELNQKPYNYRNGIVTLTNPSCDQNEDCLEINYDESTGRYIPAGIYNRRENIIDTTNDFWNRLSFSLSNGCSNLNGVYLDGILVTTIQGNGDVVLINPNIFGSPEPLISSRTRLLFNNGGRYYPIPRE